MADALRGAPAASDSDNVALAGCRGRIRDEDVVGYGIVLVRVCGCQYLGRLEGRWRQVEGVEYFADPAVPDLSGDADFDRPHHLSSGDNDAGDCAGEYWGGHGRQEADAKRNGPLGVCLAWD